MTASLLALHSLFDGALIAAAVHLSRSAGVMTGAAVMTHDLCDGLNVVIASSGYERPTREAYIFLLANSGAPILGGILAWLVIPFTPLILTLVLSLAAGSFLYSAWVHLVVQKHRLLSLWSVRSGLVVLGFLLVWATSRLFLIAS